MSAELRESYVKFNWTEKQVWPLQKRQKKERKPQWRNTQKWYVPRQKKRETRFTYLFDLRAHGMSDEKEIDRHRYSQLVTLVRGSNVDEWCFDVASVAGVAKGGAAGEKLPPWATRHMCEDIKVQAGISVLPFGHDISRVKDPDAATSSIPVSGALVHRLAPLCTSRLPSFSCPSLSISLFLFLFLRSFSTISGSVRKIYFLG